MPTKESAFGGKYSYRDLSNIGRRLGRSRQRDELKHYVDQMKSDDSVEVQRASAVVSNASDIEVELFQEFIPDFIQILEKNSHRSAPRAIFRILEKIQSISDDTLGPIIDISFRYLNNPKKSIAEKVFAMTVIANQIDKYPDLRHELEASLSAQIKTGSAGFKSRAGKIAKAYDLNL